MVESNFGDLVDVEEVSRCLSEQEGAPFVCEEFFFGWVCTVKVSFVPMCLKVAVVSILRMGILLM